jgi:DNA mismatch repair protein MutL
MGKIRILDGHVANQIAAGEVVERPSSVVKELVENAIDAGSTRIDVIVEEGGMQLIRVVDNGSGIEPDDCEAAFLRHATSKIATGRDLFRIRTLGFRGEALPSIAAVARVECVTSAQSDGLGRRLLIEGGTVRRVEDAAASRGTDISVRDLFYNTPARLKYMKSTQTELGHISDFLYRIALAYPQIAFSLKHNGNLLMRTLGNGDLLQVIAAIYGASAARSMVPLQGENLDYTLVGYVSRPELTRANRSAVTTIVNGRFVRNYALAQAALGAYHTLLPVNRYPLAVLRIDMDPTLVDVNVHPAKLEVRFSKEDDLLQFVAEQIRLALKRQNLIPHLPGKPPFARSARLESAAVVQERFDLYGEPASARDKDPGGRSDGWADRTASAGKVEATKAASASGGAAPAGAHYGADNGARAAGDGSQIRSRRDFSDRGGALGGDARSSASTGFLLPASDQAGGFHGRPRASAAGSHTAGAPAAGASSRSAAGPVHRPAPPCALAAQMLAASADGEPSADGPAFPRLVPVGQVHGTYIVAQNEDGLYLIDQHAAHERINYEWYFEKFGNPAQASQELLVPITLEFTPAEAERIRANLALFEQVGVFMEPFGGGTFLVRAHPHWFPQGEEKAIVEEIAEWVLSEKKAVDLAKLREKSAIACSCKASIKANESLSLQEIEALIARLSRCRNPFTCPHGRPVVVSFSKYELEKMFKRVM